MSSFRRSPVLFLMSVILLAAAHVEATAGLRGRACRRGSRATCQTHRYCVSPCAVTQAATQPACGAESATETQPHELADLSAATPQPTISTVPEVTPEKDDWQSLFDGDSLAGWQSTNYGGEGAVSVEEGSIIVDMGSPLSGITRTGSIPEGDYELELDAKKIDGHDFFCGLTFPAKEAHCSLIVGGWGGGLVGISSLDGSDASENDTTRFKKFDADRWYHIRVRVTDKHLSAWIDDDHIVDRDIENTRIGVRAEVELSRPLGLCTFETRSAFRNIRWRNIAAP